MKYRRKAFMKKIFYIKSYKRMLSKKLFYGKICKIYLKTFQIYIRKLFHIKFKFESKI